MMHFHTESLRLVNTRETKDTPMNLLVYPSVMHNISEAADSILTQLDRMMHLTAAFMYAE